MIKPNKKLAKFLFTIQRRIIDFSDNIEQNVMAKLKNCQFILQINESTDISNHAQLLALASVIDEGVIPISLLQKFTIYYKRSRCLWHSYNLPQKA